jgi:hypothetical protein
MLTFAPRLTCQQITRTATTTACGHGAEFGLQVHSDDGMTTAAVQIQSDWIDGQTSSIAELRFEYRF